MTKSSFYVIAGLLAVSVAIACTATKPSTGTPTGVGASATTGKTSASLPIIRPGKPAITNKDANAAFYERAKQGFKATIPNYFADDELRFSVANVGIDYRLARTKPMATKAEAMADADDEPDVDAEGHHEDGEFESDHDDSPDTPTENYADEPGELEGLVTMQVSAGGGPAHQIEILEEDFPPMSEHADEATYVDKTSGKKIKFSADQDFVRFTANDGTNKLVIVLNPDNTLTIDGQPANTMQQAADLIRAKAISRNASVETLMALYAGLSLREKDVETLANCGRVANRGEAGPEEPVDIEALMRAVLAGLTK